MWRKIVIYVIGSCAMWKTGYIDIPLEQIEFVAAGLAWVSHQIKTLREK